MAEEEERTEDRNKGLYSIIRRPEKYRIGEDFDLFLCRISLYIEAIDLKDDRKKRLALFFNLSDEQVLYVEGTGDFKL